MINHNGEVFPGPSLPIFMDISYHASVSINVTHSMLLGGVQNDDCNFCNKTWFFDHQQKNWSLGPQLETGRIYHTAGIVIDKETKEHNLAVIGGVDDKSSTLKSVELLNLNSTTIYKWKQGKSH